MDLLAATCKSRVGHAPGMPGTFSPPPTSKETASKRSRHASRHVIHARAVMHVGIAKMRGKRSRHFRRLRNPQFYVSGKRPMGADSITWYWYGPLIHGLSNRGVLIRQTWLLNNSTRESVVLEYFCNVITAKCSNNWCLSIALSVTAGPWVNI